MTGYRIPLTFPVLAEPELEAVSDAVRSGWVSSTGPAIGEFESLFATFCEVPHGVAVMNGTAALHLALEALDIGPGDEVIVPDLTFAASAEAVVHAGAVPVLVDVDAATWALDPSLVEAACTPRTKAIMPVHLYGHPADMDPILAVAEARGLAVVEDAAEAHGARYRGKRVGSIGHIGAFSFYGNKLLTTGEGGMCVTHDAALAERMRFLRAHAQPAGRRYWHDEVGWNYRMTNLQAALGAAQMKRVDEVVADRQRLGRLYHDALDGTGITAAPEQPWAETVYWLYSALLPSGVDRDRVMALLAEEGIETRPFFYPLHEMPPYRADASGFPVATDLSRRGMTLPSFYRMGEADVAAVVGAVRDASSRA
ncbi:MAG TPA: DegT/DnrJ/EryC1/StrS family aminotransferase [Candidatus Limnocylindria bacterium]|nr:DegT/DnrJ/EryC1/StrS family aminotransferase [Candidatus Limnocylindria bacterium]